MTLSGRRKALFSLQLLKSYKVKSVTSIVPERSRAKQTPNAETSNGRDTDRASDINRCNDVTPKAFGAVR